METRRRAGTAFRDRNREDPAYRAKRAAGTKRYVERNRERSAEYQRDYAAKNTDHKRAASKLWREQNREKIRVTKRRTYERRRALGLTRLTPEQAERRRQNDRKRRKTDPGFVVDDRMSANIRLSIRDRKAGRGWESLVGYTLAQLMTHLERQFLKGMTWANIGEWHIDHIVPKSAFSYDSAESDQFRACWAITNLRPLWAADNISKHSKRLVLL